MALEYKVKDETVLKGRVRFTDYSNEMLELEFDNAEQISLRTLSNDDDGGPRVFFDKRAAATLAKKLLVFVEGGSTCA